MRFETTDINRTSFLAVAGFVFDILRQPNSNQALFDFEDTPQLRDALMDYERGVSLPAKTLLLTRTRLYHEASNVARGGGRHV